MPDETEQPTFLSEVAEYFRLRNVTEDATAEAHNRNRQQWRDWYNSPEGAEARDVAHAGRAGGYAASAWGRREQAYYDEGKAIDARAGHGFAKARTALAQSEDPVVLWIADHALPTYQHEAHQALKAFRPGGNRREELEAANALYDWCNVYRVMRGRMMQAGVLAEDPTYPARNELVTALRSRGWSEVHITTALEAFYQEQHRRYSDHA
jgi:hypothetical protein